MSNVTFLGLGVMGHGMAENLLAAGHDVTVWNRSAAKAAELVRRGATAAATPHEAVAGAEYVLYCLADDEAVRHVVLGDGGIAHAVDGNALVIDLSTISPATALAEHAAYDGRGVRFLDAPVFGSRGEAATGGLWIVVGGDERAFEAARPILEPLAETLHYLGPAGNGTRMKLVGNLLVAAQLESLGEAFTLAKLAGLDLRTVHEVISVTDFRTPIYDAVGASIISGDYEANFALGLMQKDGRLIEQLARDLGAPIPAATAAFETVDKAVTEGLSDENASALVKILAKEGGVDLTE